MDEPLLQPQLSLASVGLKYDKTKEPVYRGVLHYFPNALLGVSNISAFGALKYDWENWRTLENGEQRYTDALLRHLIHEARGEKNDPESGLPHSWHVAWNALARAELQKRE